jgi:hypothetical protein
METPIPNQVIMQTKPLVVTNDDDLDSLTGLIHDEFFCLDDVTFSSDQGMVTIQYRRIFHGHPGRMIRNWLIAQTYEVDVIRSQLTIRNVEDYSVEDKSHIGTYSFNKVYYSNSVLMFRINEDLDLKMVVPKLEIESRDLEVRGKVRITHGFLWSSYTSSVYE